MTTITSLEKALDPADVAAQLDAEGYVVLSRAIAPEEARELAAQADTLKSLHRASLDSLDLGQGDMLRFGSALPAPWAAWREALYRGLAPVANRWNGALDVGYRYPSELEAFLQLNRKAGQTQPLSHLNRLREGDYLALHQRNEGEHVFPLQVVALLSEPGKDFHGGEFVLTEQRPRMQSRPMVLPLGLGDMAVVTTAQKPFRGTWGFYRVNLKHAISRVREGERIGVELSFHDAP